MALIRTDGLVLRTRDLGEADKVVVLFTKDKGKMEAAARGARRARSALLAATQPFTLGHYLIFTNRSLHNLSQGQLLRSFRRLREDLLLLAEASYITELTDIGWPLEEEDEDTFYALLAALDLLDCGAVPSALVLRWYELQLMRALGFLPELDYCLDCRQPLVAMGGAEFFDPQGGGGVCHRCAPHRTGCLRISRDLLPTMRSLLSTASDNLASFPAGGAVMGQLEELMASFIKERLEREPNSRVFLQALLNKEVK
ncbi:MAG TPA: DNA repair protein RecO [Firmicutes bacterium]|nr:DNA repair protein RecO [Bacillota bacterium]